MTKKKDRKSDFNLFKRLLKYLKPYSLVFYSLNILVILLAVFSAATPYITKQAIDVSIAHKAFSDFMFYVFLMFVVLILQTTFQLLYIYYAAWLGQSLVRDVRTKLFNHILRFKMKYYDNSSVGVLITRSVTDMERIADIFGDGLFMIVRDVLTMIVVFGFMLYLNLKLSLIVFILLPILLYATRVFHKYMKIAFEEVRNEVSNLNSFVQERITGMKILQLFTRVGLVQRSAHLVRCRLWRGRGSRVWRSRMVGL